jgi:hypothetical protein
VCTSSQIPPHPDPLLNGEREKSARGTSTVSRGAVIIAAMLQASLSEGERVPERSEGG